MIALTLSILLSLLFILLGLLHFYWASGGKWGLAKALPTRENEEIVMKPKKIDSISVGLGLSLFGIYYFFQSGFIHSSLPVWIVIYGGWIIPSLFILRAIGEFKYVGFFKKVKNTKFAKADSLFFSPLCLSIGVLGIIIQLMN